MARRDDRTRPGSHELARKAIHIIASIAAAIVVLQTPPAISPWIFVGTVVIAILIDEARLRNDTLGRIFARAFGGMLRHRETTKTTGATTLAAGFAIAVILLPPLHAAAGILVAGVGDAAAALAGQSLGRHRLRTGKSLEGAIACFAAALPAAWLLPGITLAPAAIIAAATAMLELIPAPFDDNLWLAPAAGLIALAATAPLV